MRQIGTYRGYTIFWCPPEYDGGTGSGEVMVGLDSVGTARSQSEAIELAQRHIDYYMAKNDR